MNRRLLFIANYFPPISGPGSIRPYFFLKHIRKEFESVTVVSASNDPNYGLDTSFQLNQWNNVKFQRFEGNDYSKFQQLLFRFKLFFPFLFFFPVRYFERQYCWKSQSSNWLKQHLKSNKYDVIYVTSGPFSSAILAYEISKRFGIPYVIDMRDPFSSSPSRNWPSFWHWRWFRKLEGKVLKQASAVIVVAEGMRNELLQIHPDLQPEKVHVIMNGFNGDMLPRKYHDHSKYIEVAYAGSLHDYDGKEMTFDPKWWSVPYRRKNYNTGLRSLYWVIQGLRLMDPNLRANFKFKLYGNHQLPLTRTMIKEHGLDVNFEFCGKIPFDQIHGVLRNSDFLLLPMEERIDGEESYFLTGKLFEWIKLNMPILCIGKENEAIRLLQNIGVSHRRASMNAKEVVEMLTSIWHERHNDENLNSSRLNANELVKCTREHQAELLRSILIHAAS